MRIRNLVLAVVIFLAGALSMYGYLWYQVYHKLDKTMCQVFHGEASVEPSPHCKKILDK